MGRARGSIEAAGDTSFAALFGARRGALQNDTVLAEYPSEQARAELRELVEAPGFRETQTALRLLRQHRALIDERPLLGELRGALCAAAARRAGAAHSPQTKRLAALCGVRDQSAEQLFCDNRDVLHICPEGREAKVSAVHTVCGIPLSRSDMYPAKRGSWRRPASNGVRHCETCAQYADIVADCEETDRSPALCPADADALEVAVAQAARVKLDGALSAGQAPEERSLHSVAHSAYQPALIELLARRLHEGGPASVYHAVGKDHWRALRAKRETAELDARVLDYEDWREFVESQALASARPQKLGSEELRRELLAARQEAFGMVADAVGVKRR